MPNDLCKGRELAERLKVSPDTISAWSRQGRFKAYRLSKKAIRYSLSEVMAALGAGSTPEAATEPQLVLA